MIVSRVTYFRDFIYGLIMGWTSTIPGISFGTVAILLNIYEKLLDALSLANLRKSSPFLIPLCIGVIFGVFTFSKLVTFLIIEHEMITYFCFSGMIIGCTPMIYKRANLDKIKLQNVAVFVLAFAFMLMLALISDDTNTNRTIAQFGGVTPNLLAFIFIAGFISAMAMIIPGISGSIVMLILGSYTISVEAVSTFNIAIIFTVGVGIILGSLTGIKIIRIILKLMPQVLYCSVLGLMIGSILIIYPGFILNFEGIVAIILGLICIPLIYAFSKKN